jgi:ABC-2 type transport system ATP-binding protein
MGAVEVRDLRKAYGSFEAVKGIDLHVDAGEVFALLGPNGAGKTTTVEILEGHRTRSGGEVSILGSDPGKGDADLKRRIGIVLQETGIEPYLTVEEAIELYRGYYPHPRPLDEIIELVGLEEKRKVRVNKLSGGQQRRLDVAIGLAGDPELLFLDEPTTGFDPSARRNAWQMIRNLRALGKTVFLTTHYMDEAEVLADRAAILVGGKIRAQGNPRELVAGETNVTFVEFSLPDGSARPPGPLMHGASIEEGVVRIKTADTMRTLHDLTGWALENDVELIGLNVARPSLEDVFIEVTQRGEG